MTKTRLKIWTTLIVLGAVLLAARSWSAFPRIDEGPISSKVTPSTEDGRWIIVRAWVEVAPAYVTITAGNNVDPPGCTTGQCASPYSQRLQVKRGQQVVFTIRSKQWKGRAKCTLLAPGEHWEAKVPPGARQDNQGAAGAQGGVTCIRTVTW